MKRFKFITSAMMGISMVSSIGFTASAQDAKIPMEDFFRKPEKVSYQLSPDGTYFSYMAPYNDRMNVFVQKVG